MTDDAAKGAALAEEVAAETPPPPRPVLSPPMELAFRVDCECGRKHSKVVKIAALVQEVPEAPRVQLASAVPPAGPHLFRGRK